MSKEVIDIPDGWYLKRSIPQLLLLRSEFIEQMQVTPTCDTCVDVTRCALAYDRYNTDGDCLLSK